jgi:hypothetical protein
MLKWQSEAVNRRTDNTIVKMTNCCHNSWVISYIYTGYKTLVYTDFWGCNMTKNRMQIGEPYG